MKRHFTSLSILVLLGCLWPAASGHAQSQAQGHRHDLTAALGLSASGGQFAQLFVPQYYSPPADGRFKLVFHFHSATWAAENALWRAGLNALLFNIHLGGFSSPYQSYFSHPQKFREILDTVLAQTARHGIIANAHLDTRACARC